MEVQKKQLQVFGYGFAVIFVFIAVRLWLKHGWVVFPSVLAALALVLAGITWRRLEGLVPVYQRWMKVVHGIGLVVTTVILTLVFYLVFGVAGIILRLMRKDLLDRRIEPERRSYWRERTEKEKAKASYLQQF